MEDNYLIEYSQIENLSIKEFINLLYLIEGKEINELKIRHLSFHNGKEIWPGEGVYIFRRKRDVVYVGKVSSMSFTERIGKHFDLREDAWMNRLLKLISERELNQTGFGMENLKVASLYAHKHLNLVLINFKWDEKNIRNPFKINGLERLLRSSTNALNKFKSFELEDYNQTVHDYLKNLEYYG